MDGTKLSLSVTVFVVVLAASTHAQWQVHYTVGQNMLGGNQNRDGPLNNNGFWRSVSDRLDSALGQDYTSSSKTR